MEYDLIIIGAGPAGLTAGIYASRRNLKTLIISQDIGGQLATAPWIENYPGIEPMSGLDLAIKMQKQAENLKVEFEFSVVNDIKKETDKFTINTESEKKFEANAIILAFGLTHRHLQVPGEKELSGKGVCYCATCDGPLYRDKEVAIIGGGNSALNAALYLADICKKVYLVHRRDQFRAEEFLVNKIKQLNNVELVLNSVTEKINGQEFVESIDLKNVKTQKTKNIELKGVFIETGYEAKSEFLKNLCKTDERNQIIIDQECRTNIEGCFAAGDVTHEKYKQVVIAAGAGAKAALQAYNYIKMK